MGEQGLKLQGTSILILSDLCIISAQLRLLLWPCLSNFFSDDFSFPYPIYLKVVILKYWTNSSSLLLLTSYQKILTALRRGLYL